jgi:tetratricopeptide (TPR) repeat protein
MKIKYTIFLAIYCLLTFACEKGFLEKKPDKALVVPVSLSDFQALMDHYDEVNRTPGLIEVASDDYYVLDGEMQSQYNTIKNSYVWAKEIYDGEDSFMHVDWSKPYAQIFRMNVVLDGLENLSEKEKKSTMFNTVKGTALFHRSYHFFSLVQAYANAYGETSSALELGIPLKLNADVNVLPARATVKETYEQILNDLMLSASLLPEAVSFKTRPTKYAAKAMLARVYLSMSNFSKAEDYAHQVLEKNGELMNFNTITNFAGRFPRALPVSNAEIIFYSVQNSFSFMYSSSAIVDTVLYNLYEENDLRKKMFYVDMGNKRINFKGSYDGTGLFFSGLATDEMYLIKAECLARSNNLVGAMESLNKLLSNRYSTNSFSPKLATDQQQALTLILDERRKELVFRGLRWLDLKRINKEGSTQITLKRSYNGVTYILKPNSNRYAFPIPFTEIANHPNIVQNNRD